MYTRTISALAALALTAGTLALSTPLNAAPLDEQVQVRTGDLDLSNPADAATLDRRLRSAARRICGPVPAQDLDMQRQVVDCQADILAAARQDVALAKAGSATPYRVALRIP